MRVYALFGWKWISSGHRFSPELSRLTPSISSCPMVSAVSLAGCAHRLLFPLEPTKANQTLGRLNFSWLAKSAKLKLFKKADAGSSHSFSWAMQRRHVLVRLLTSLWILPTKSTPPAKLRINRFGTIFSTIWPILWIITGLVITGNIAPKNCLLNIYKFDFVIFASKILHRIFKLQMHALQ